MSSDPFYMRLLEKLGVNTTKLRWRLYQRERQVKQLREGGPIPKGLSWLRYEHKICLKCGAVNDRNARVCSSCSESLPSMLGYRVRRVLKTVTPADQPIVVQVFIGVMLLVFGVGLFLEGFSFGALMQPMMGITFVLGGFSADWAFGGGQWWRLLSFGLVHGGLIHIGFNSYVLMQIGPLIESQIARARMLILITFTQLGSACACFFWYTVIQGRPGQPVVGASGWLFGLIGFGIGYFHQMGPGGKGMRDQLVRWAVMVLILGFILPGISNSAHLGGLAAGLIFGVIPEDRARHLATFQRTWIVGAGMCLALWLVALFFMGASVVHFWPELQQMR